MTNDAVTTFLRRWHAGDADDSGLGTVLPLVYEELRAMAQRQLRTERAGHTLQPTALVHEAYLRLVDHDRVEWQNRQHFLSVAAMAMRRLLVDHARERRRLKRGGDQVQVTFTVSLPVTGEDQIDEIVAIDDLLDTLAGFDPRAARVVECRYYAGLGVEETAAALGTSPRTVKRTWQLARAWLRKELGADA
ncbi:MAG TPA: sigma-70 family RNA polymerase sigma factor [Candidatus Krumholzibacteria bacterium]|nr:sigma-70 family RNA polymerase sigma factor [Candidatus Krumholzibacteria bacterium]